MLPRQIDAQLFKELFARGHKWKTVFNDQSDAMLFDLIRQTQINVGQSTAFDDSVTIYPKVELKKITALDFPSGVLYAHLKAVNYYVLHRDQFDTTQPLGYALSVRKSTSADSDSQVDDFVVEIAMGNGPLPINDTKTIDLSASEFRVAVNVTRSAANPNNNLTGVFLQSPQRFSFDVEFPMNLDSIGANALGADHVYRFKKNRQNEIEIEIGYQPSGKKTYTAYVFFDGKILTDPSSQIFALQSQFKTLI